MKQIRIYAGEAYPHYGFTVLKPGEASREGIDLVEVTVDAETSARLAEAAKTARWLQDTLSKLMSAREDEIQTRRDKAKALEDHHE